MLTIREIRKRLSFGSGETKTGQTGSTHTPKKNASRIAIR